MRQQPSNGRRAGVRVLSAEEAAAELGMHVQTFRRLARAGHLKATKIGGRWGMTRIDLLHTQFGELNNNAKGSTDDQPVS